MWKSQKSTLTEKIFRQINYLVISSLVNTLVSRHFCKNILRVNFRNFHTMCREIKIPFVSQSPRRLIIYIFDAIHFTEKIIKHIQMNQFWKSAIIRKINFLTVSVRAISQSMRTISSMSAFWANQIVQNL